jgi:hypothetical protein
MFVDGVHTQVAPDGNLWVNLAAVDAWVTGQPVPPAIAMQPARAIKAVGQ